MTVVFSFDIHDSNLPLQSDLTVMMRNLFKFALPWIVEENSAPVGSPLNISLLPYADRVLLLKPDNTVSELSMSDFSCVFTPTEVGIYRITEKSDEKNVYKDVFIHIPESESSVQKLDGLSVDKAADYIKGSDGDSVPKAATHMSVWIAAAALVLMLVEWGMSCREEL